MQSLHTLLERELAERDIALATLTEAQGKAQAAQFLSEQLLAYRAEYEQRWSRRFARHGAMEFVDCHDGVLPRLEPAIELQQRVARNAQVQLERMNNEVQACELRVASVRELIERRLAAEVPREPRIGNACAIRADSPPAAPAALRA
jgi:flagellar FliJ protein